MRQEPRLTGRIRRCVNGLQLNRLRSALFVATLVVALNFAAGQSYPVEPLIRVNQFGYLPGSLKVAVISDPRIGFNAEEVFTGGATYQVRRRDDDSIVYEGTPTAWKNGATHLQSGDRGWWFDFTEVSEPGEYYLWDVDREVGMHGFETSATVFNRVIDAAVRVFYYQRLAFTKTAEHAGEAWVDGEAFNHPGQDTEARSVRDRDNPETERDLRGGWMDAGDYNKYVTFAAGPVHQFLSAYEENRGVFRDDLNIPESGHAGEPDETREAGRRPGVDIVPLPPQCRGHPGSFFGRMVNRSRAVGNGRDRGALHLGAYG